jgi:hypothetical protein
MAADVLMKHNPLQIIKDKSLPPAEPDWFE